jgi:hypothetical protein
MPAHGADGPVSEYSSRPAGAPMGRQMPELRLAEPLPDHARDCLVRALAALDSHTDAPLRLAGYASDGACEVFELHEEFELGVVGRRFLMSVTASGRDALLIPLDPNLEEK